MALLPTWGILQFLVWPRVQPFYSALVVKAADGALAVIEMGHRVTTLTSQGTYIHVFSALSKSTEPSATYDADVLHFYAVLFVSLFLVFPGLGVARRARLLLISLGALFAFHVVVVLINVEYMYAVEMTEISTRHYTPGEISVYQWLHDTVDFFAVQTIPALALVTLVVFYGGFLPRLSLPAPAPSAQPPAARGPRVSHRRAALTGAAVVMILLLVWLALRPKVGARQAEMEISLASAALRELDFPTAEKHFTAALARDYGLLWAREGLGITNFLQQRFKEAAGLLRAVIDEEPGRVKARVVLGKCLIGLEDYTGAALQFQTAQQTDPRNAEAGYGLALSLEKLGRPEEAETALRQVLESHPEHTRAAIDLIRMLFASERECEAVPLLKAAQAGNLAPQQRALVEQSMAQLETVCGAADRTSQSRAALK